MTKKKPINNVDFILSHPLGYFRFWTLCEVLNSNAHVSSQRLANWDVRRLKQPNVRTQNIKIHGSLHDGYRHRISIRCTLCLCCKDSSQYCPYSKFWCLPVSRVHQRWRPCRPWALIQRGSAARFACKSKRNGPPLSEAIVVWQHNQKWFTVTQR